jgi:hypothetical protein
MAHCPRELWLRQVQVWGWHKADETPELRLRPIVRAQTNIVDGAVKSDPDLLLKLIAQCTALVSQFWYQAR